MKTILLTDVSSDLDHCHMANKGKYMKIHEHFYIEKEAGRLGSTWYINKPTWKSQRKKGKYSCVGGITQLYIYWYQVFAHCIQNNLVWDSHCLQRVGKQTTMVLAKFSFLQMPLLYSYSVSTLITVSNLLSTWSRLKRQQTLNLIILRKKKNHISQNSKNFCLLWPKCSSRSSPCLNCDGITVHKVNMLGQLLQTEQPAMRMQR